MRCFRFLFALFFFLFEDEVTSLFCIRFAVSHASHLLCIVRMQLKLKNLFCFAAVLCVTGYSISQPRLSLLICQAILQHEKHVFLLLFSGLIVLFFCLLLTTPSRSRNNNFVLWELQVSAKPAFTGCALALVDGGAITVIANPLLERDSASIWSLQVCSHLL